MILLHVVYCYAMYFPVTLIPNIVYIRHIRHIISFCATPYVANHAINTKEMKLFKVNNIIIDMNIIAIPILFISVIIYLVKLKKLKEKNNNKQINNHIIKSLKKYKIIFISLCIYSIVQFIILFIATIDLNLYI